MGKISKSDLPIDRRPHHEIMQDFFKSTPCQHFKVGTGVVRNNVRGDVVGESKDGGTQIIILWEDGIHTVMPNPNYRSNT